MRRITLDAILSLVKSMFSTLSASISANSTGHVDVPVK